MTAPTADREIRHNLRLYQQSEILQALFATIPFSKGLDFDPPPQKPYDHQSSVDTDSAIGKDDRSGEW